MGSKSMKKIRNCFVSIEHNDLGIILTTPERKPAVIFEDNFRPGVKLGDYVTVEVDSLPGNN
jgi:hypothetical protein